MPSNVFSAKKSYARQASFIDNKMNEDDMLECLKNLKPKKESRPTVKGNKGETTEDMSAKSESNKSKDEISEETAVMSQESTNFTLLLIEEYIAEDQVKLNKIFELLDKAGK